MSRFACPGRSSASSAWSRSTVWTRRRVSASRRSVSIRSASSSPSSCSTRRVWVRTATIAMECASRASVLRLWPVSKSRTRAASLAGTSTTCSPSSSSRCASGRPAPLLPSTAQTRSGQAVDVLAHGRVAGPVGGEPPRAEQLLVLVDDLDRGRQLVGIDPDDHAVSMCCSRLCSIRRGRRGGHCYYELGSPFLSHASSRRPAGCRPIVSHTSERVGSRMESCPAGHLDRVWPDVGPTESSSSRLWTALFRGIAGVHITSGRAVARPTGSQRATLSPVAASDARGLPQR